MMLTAMVSYLLPLNLLTQSFSLLLLQLYCIYSFLRLLCSHHVACLSITSLIINQNLIVSASVIISYAEWPAWPSLMSELILPFDKWSYHKQWILEERKVRSENICSIKWKEVNNLKGITISINDKNKYNNIINS